MTEIKIEKKKSALPWVLLGLGIIALLLYFFVIKNNNNEVANSPATSSIDVHEKNSTVTAYINFISSDTNKMSIDHSYTNEALLKLTNATNALADQVGYNLKADLDKVKEYADKITNDPFETSHADAIRKSANIISTALQNMQQAKFPGLESEVAEVKSAAEAINPAMLTLDQRDAVKNFFGKTAYLLGKMN